MKNKQIKLNLGCGSDHKNGFINIDIDKRLKPDLVHDVRNKLPFKANSVDHILLQDVLEHLTKEDGEKLLKDCSRVLRVGGTIDIRVPNLKKIFQKYGNYDDILMLFLYGDTSVSGEWGAHKYGYTPFLMKQILVSNNIELFSEQVDDTNYKFLGKKVDSFIENRYVIFGSGWMPKKLIRTAGHKVDSEGEIIVCTDSFSYLIITVLAILAGKEVVWCVSQRINPFLSKFILRQLAPYVSFIYSKNRETNKFIREVLRYSHLRIQ